MQEILTNTESLMIKAIESLKRDLGTVSTGRANPNLLDTVKVESYGSYMPLKQVANVSVSDSSTIVVQAWDKSTVPHIEKAIIAANLGLNPMADGMTIRINIPKLSEERRKELCKVVKRYGEDKKIAIRNARKDGLEAIKKIAKEHSEDLVKDTEKEVQNLTDKYCKNVDDLVTIKEKDLLTI
ncbi:MAG: ribosome recycling factor [Rickettsiales bacterium]|nr:ribosome recycling factor [Rickettsiales bacterium]